MNIDEMVKEANAENMKGHFEWDLRQLEIIAAFGRECALGAVQEIIDAIDKSGSGLLSASEVRALTAALRQSQPKGEL